MATDLPAPTVTELFLESTAAQHPTACGRCGEPSGQGADGALVSVRGRLLGWCCASCASEVAA